MKARKLQAGDFTNRDVAKLYSRVARMGRSQCWQWSGYTNNRGYGVMYFQGQYGKATGGRIVRGRGMLYVHRVAWALTNGVAPSDKLVCHKCDNPICVNPEHLFLGDHRANTQDMMKKGRGKYKTLKGENSPAHKITERDVVHIRRQYSEGGITQAALAECYGIDSSAVSLIIRRKNWRHVK